MRRYALLLPLLFLLALPFTSAHAQTPEPEPEPSGVFDVNEVQDVLGGGLPGPIPINPPSDEFSRVTDELWKIENLRGMISMVQTVWLLANQNFLINAIITMSVLMIAITWLLKVLASRSNNL